MGKASSSKKVQRAARAAAASRGASERRELGFPLIMGFVVILGIGLVVAANVQQDNEVKSAPLLTDHWHAAYSIWDCDQYLTSFQESQNDPQGIHSHADGLIHIHPFTSNVTGGKAQLGVFLEAMFVSLDEDRLESREHGVVEAGSDCDGEPTVLRVARFRVDPQLDLVEIIDTDLESIQFNRDREAFTIARVPIGSDIPEPERSVLDQLARTTGGPVTSPGPVEVPLADVEPDADADADADAEPDAEPDADAG